MNSLPNTGSSNHFLLPAFTATQLRLSALWGMASLVLTVLLMELSNIDLQVQHYLWTATTQSWLWPAKEPIGRFFIYDGLKLLLELVALGFLLAAIWQRFGCAAPSGPNRAKVFSMVFVCLISAPLLVSALKHSSNIACPRDLTLFGGDVEKIGLFDRYQADNRPTVIQKCFPAGHASIGFSFFALAFLFRTRKTQFIVIGSAFVLGAIMGTYNMLIGDHFLSHTLVSMELAWISTSVWPLIWLRKELRVQECSIATSG